MPFADYQLTFVQNDNRLRKALETKKYLVFFKNEIDWEIFRFKLREVYCKSNDRRGQPPYDELLMFKILVLGKIHNDMPPHTLEASINADITFQYFLNISNTDRIPDEKTIRNYRDALGDRFKERGIRFFGPEKKGAILEAEKSYARSFAKRYNIWI